MDAHAGQQHFQHSDRVTRQVATEAKASKCSQLLPSGLAAICTPTYRCLQHYPTPSTQAFGFARPDSSIAFRKDQGCFRDSRHRSQSRQPCRRCLERPCHMNSMILWNRGSSIPEGILSSSPSPEALCLYGIQPCCTDEAAELEYLPRYLPESNLSLSVLSSDSAGLISKDIKNALTETFTCTRGRLDSPTASDRSRRAREPSCPSSRAVSRVFPFMAQRCGFKIAGT